MSELLLAAIAGGIVVVLAVRRRRRHEPIDVSTFQQRRAAYNRELNRARRAQRPLTVVVFALDRDAAESAGLDSGASSMTRLVYLLVGSIVRDLLREHDLVAYDPGTDRYVMLLVESNRAEAVKLIARIREEVLVRSTLRLQAGWAQLPDDGLTLSDLVRHAGDRINSLNAPAEVERVDRLPASSPAPGAANTARQMHNRS